MSKKILVVNGRSYGDAVRGLGEIVTNPAELVNNPKDFGLVLFTGGSDVSPEYYGESSPKRLCGTSPERDRQEKEIFDFAIENGIRTIGICRGVQFINVMSGGTMFHHVNNHGGCTHPMKTSNGHVIEINSYHHQMVIPPHDAHVIGWSKKRRSDEYYGNFDLPVTSPDKEPEAVLFPSTKSAGVQYHPEMMDSDTDGYRWFHDLARVLMEEPNFDSIVKLYTEETCKGQQQSTHAAQ